MHKHNYLFYISFLLIIMLNQQVMASSTATKVDLKSVKRTAVENDNDRLRLENAAVLLANYEIEAKKLVDIVDTTGSDKNTVSVQAEKLLTLSENFMESAQFRLPQCDVYLTKTISLKESLNVISHDTLEKDYHHDGALPKAPGECYHTKDLFVHPATVIVLTRDDPELGNETRQSIKAEITEVLAHTEVVRQLVIY